MSCVPVKIEFYGPVEPDGVFALYRQNRVEGELVNAWTEVEGNVCFPCKIDFVLMEGLWRVVSVGLKHAQYCAVDFEVFPGKPSTVIVRCPVERNYS